MQNLTKIRVRRPSRALRGIVIAGVVAAALVLSACSSTGSTSPTAKATSAGGPIRVAIAPTGTSLPVLVAVKEGYFKAAGLDVSYQVSNVTISDQLATLGHQFDIAMGTQPALLAGAQQGLPLVYISGGALDTKANPQSNFVAGANTGITSYKGLSGKTLGSLTLTGNIHYVVLYSALKAGVKLDSINWVVGTPPLLPDSLKAGRVQGIEEIEPFAGLAAANGGTKIGDPFRSIGSKAYLGIFLADKTWANSHEAQVLKFNSALEKAAGWIPKHPTQARQIIGSYTGATGAVLANTPIPDFQFQTTSAQVKSVLTPDVSQWISILKKVTGQGSNVTPADVLPKWAGK